MTLNTRFLSIATLALFVFITALGQARAADGDGASPWIKTKQTSVRLVSATEGVGDAKTIQLGLQFKIKKGWKIYWRNPGDAGFPPRLDWKESENLGKVEFRWPAPKRFEVLGFQSMGYKDEVVFPITASVNDPAKPLKLRAKLVYLVCDEVCVPYSTNLSFDLGVGGAQATEHFQKISKFSSLVPGDGSAHGLSIEKVETAGPFQTVDKDVRKGFLRIVAKSNVRFQKPDVFIEGPELAFFSAPVVRLSGDGKTATLIVPATEEEETKLNLASLKLTVIDEGRSAEKTLKVLEGAAEAPIGSELPVSLALILVFAVIGGLILNLMPCVLPVLSLKVLSFVGHGGAEKSVIRKSFTATSLGILFSFMVIAAALFGLKAAGAAVGWGIQFQHPWFIVGLTVLVMLFAYNLWGMFELRLPEWASDIAGGSTGQAEDHHSFAGNFGTGAFATVLATPCSAPFLGTAVGFALAGNNIDIFAVFFALGLGMALPYILIAAFPVLASRLPKPGNWMITMKKALGFALAATALWLLSVLAVQLSVSAALIVGALMAAMGVALYSRGRMPESLQKAASLGVAVIIIAAFATPYSYSPRAATGQILAKAAHWQPFDPAAIPRLVAQGKTVFVDITAEWCITCQVNKVAVLNRGDVFELLSGDQVIAMQGDWTRPDPKITAYLKSFNRFGIPFNAIYGPGAPSGLVLPELLTSGFVLDGLAKGSANKVIVSR